MATPEPATPLAPTASHGQASAPQLAFVNVLTVDPGKQVEVVERITALAQQMREVKGFVSAAVHRSLDGKKAVIYARWESLAAFVAMRKDPRFGPGFSAIADLAVADPVICEVAESVTAPAGPWFL